MKTAGARDLDSIFLFLLHSTNFCAPATNLPIVHQHIGLIHHDIYIIDLLVLMKLVFDVC